jgi:hypothetical protein
MAEEFVGKKTIFICDIRSMSKDMSDAEKEERVVIDMKSQMNWVQTMKPKASMLKFRLPYPPPAGSTKYLDGDIFFPVWGGRTTSESRLMVTDPDKLRVYDHNDYEDLMFHFNTVTRTTYYPHSLQGEGLDHCYDCNAELFILRNYLQKIKGIEDPEELDKQVVKMSAAISRRISLTGRTLRVVT